MVIFFEAIMQFSLLLINYQQVKIVAISKYSIPGMKYLSILRLLPRSPYGSNQSFRKRVPKLEKKIPTQGKILRSGKEVELEGVEPSSSQHIHKPSTRLAMN